MNKIYKTYDEQYKRIVENITAFGAYEDNKESVRTVWADGEKATTKSLLNQVIEFDASKDSGRMSAKFVGARDPINELLWIWQAKSNDVRFLRNHFKCNVWNEWEREDGTIGKAYGYQLSKSVRKVIADELLVEMAETGKISLRPFFQVGDSIILDQVDWLLYMLTSPKHKQSRRLIVSLWNIDDLDDMELEPCVYETHWQFWNGKLNLTVKIRSNDMALGNPYNVYQYTSLLRMIAQATGNAVGKIRFNIDNAHIYDRHILDLLKHYDTIDKFIEEYDEPKSAIMILDESIESFYDFKAEHFKEAEEYSHRGRIKFEVAI